MSKIINLKQYDLVFSTSFLPLGVSGHLYEMIDYFYVCVKAGLNCSILLVEGLKKETLLQVARDKYDFNEEELKLYEDNTFECFEPVIIMTKNICITDGSGLVKSCIIYADNVFLLRCTVKDFSYFTNNKAIKNTHLLQDFKMYDERSFEGNIQVIDYKKRILWGRYKKPKLSKTNTALLYLTTAMRGIEVSEVLSIINKHDYEKFLIITNDMNKYAPLLENERVILEPAPVNNIFEKFDDYIYTTTKWQIDCSPRFIVECAVYNKPVVYEIDYSCIGVERRKEDIKENLADLELKQDDFFIKYVKSVM